MAYTIDVYRGDKEPEKKPLLYAIFVAFFPQLVAGPIGRSGDLLPQFHEEKPFSYLDAVSGLRQILWGFFKKIVIADQVGIYSLSIFGSPKPVNSLSILLGAYMFSFQIYCDFSGYSDIAIGCARMLGINLAKNFNRPYLSTSIQEFWSRWHISLSTWFRDYLYFPLMLRKNYTLGYDCLCVIFVFLVCGLWHGAAWKFVIWGAYHGGLLSIQRIIGHACIKKNWNPQMLDMYLRESMRAWLARILVFHLILFGWLIFRVNSWSYFLDIFKGLIHSRQMGGIFLDNFGSGYIFMAIIPILILVVVELLQENGVFMKIYNQIPGPIRWIAYSVVFWTIIFFVCSHRYIDNKFIYFQF